MSFRIWFDPERGAQHERIFGVLREIGPNFQVRRCFREEAFDAPPTLELHGGAICESIEVGHDVSGLAGYDHPMKFVCRGAPSERC